MKGSPPGLTGNMGEHLPGCGRVGTRGRNRSHSLADLAGRNCFKGTRDLGDILDAADSHPHFAGRSHAFSLSYCQVSWKAASASRKLFSLSSVIRLLTAILLALSLIHISEPTRLGMISYAVFCL